MSRILQVAQLIRESVWIALSVPYVPTLAGLALLALALFLLPAEPGRPSQAEPVSLEVPAITRAQNARLFDPYDATAPYEVVVYVLNSEPEASALRRTFAQVAQEETIVPDNLRRIVTVDTNQSSSWWSDLLRTEEWIDFEIDRAMPVLLVVDNR